MFFQNQCHITNLSQTQAHLLPSGCHLFDLNVYETNFTCTDKRHVYTKCILNIFHLKFYNSSPLSKKSL